ncbi:hypothetical protein BDW59DRAFT_152402 [Aspergillus cavernicola]|uniref:Secreted protein n=1 Tax=Aspergillus cavernicola TaxID=176166 RepID=A0ABR4HSR3_9EURO
MITALGGHMKPLLFSSLFSLLSPYLLPQYLPTDSSRSITVLIFARKCPETKQMMRCDFARRLHQSLDPQAPISGPSLGCN